MIAWSNFTLKSKGKKIAPFSTQPASCFTVDVTFFLRNAVIIFAGHTMSKTFDKTK